MCHFPSVVLLPTLCNSTYNFSSSWSMAGSRNKSPLSGKAPGNKQTNKQGKYYSRVRLFRGNLKENHSIHHPKSVLEDREDSSLYPLEKWILNNQRQTKNDGSYSPSFTQAVAELRSNRGHPKWFLTELEALRVGRVHFTELLSAHRLREMALSASCSC